ncbi:MAG: glycosyltransferase [Gemmatimonadetes bacterium]|nr:glycosyltransferase [Gemmatimonadota bacterium]
MSGLPATARIGFDAVRALRNSTGLGNYARHLLRGLHDAAPQLALHLYAPRPARPPFAGLSAELGATLHLPPAPWQPIGLRAIWRTTRLGRTAARDGIALYHGMTHEIPRDLPATGVPSVVTIHDLLFHTHPELFSAIDRRSYAWRYRWSIEHATALVAVSAHTRDELHQLLGVPQTRIVVVPPARDPRFAVRAPDATGAATRPPRRADRVSDRGRHLRAPEEPAARAASPRGIADGRPAAGAGGSRRWQRVRPPRGGAHARGGESGAIPHRRHRG